MNSNKYKIIHDCMIEFASTAWSSGTKKAQKIEEKLRLLATNDNDIKEINNLLSRWLESGSSSEILFAEQFGHIFKI